MCANPGGGRYVIVSGVQGARRGIGQKHCCFAAINQAGPGLRFRGCVLPCELEVRPSHLLRVAYVGGFGHSAVRLRPTPKPVRLEHAILRARGGPRTDHSIINTDRSGAGTLEKRRRRTGESLAAPLSFVSSTTRSTYRRRGLVWIDRLRGVFIGYRTPSRQNNSYGP